MTPPIIGLTGNTGAGKSAALEALARLGVPTISSDAVVHDLLATDELREALIERWGPDVAPGGALNRSRVAEIVFRDSDELAWLESQLHPRVGRAIAAWRDELDADAAVAVVEVPLLFETEMDAGFDAVLAVTAPLEVRAERAEGRGLQELEGRDGRQLPEAEKAARSDFVVANDGSLADLEAKLEALLPELKSAGR